MNPIGHKVIHLHSVDSTHNYIANLVRLKEINHGTAILADEQTHGRGQRGTTWQSACKQNLITSIFLEFNHFPISEQVSINHWVTLSVVNMLKSFDIDAKIKWPNDIFVDDKKICGILIENAINSTGIKHSLIGIGLNINQQNFEYAKAVSIKLLKGKEYDVSVVLTQLLDHLNRLFPSLLNQRDYLRSQFLENMWKRNQEVNFIWDGIETKGIIRGTDLYGLLEMQIESELHYFHLKEIQFL